MAVTKVRGADFNAEVLQQDGLVLVDFYADWCPPCRRLAPLLERFAEENAGTLKVVKVDSDVDSALSDQYVVRTIPTVIAFRGGQEVRRAVNPQTRAALEALTIQD
jgi:thioredoxin